LNLVSFDGITAAPQLAEKVMAGPGLNKPIGDQEEKESPQPITDSVSISGKSGARAPYRMRETHEVAHEMVEGIQIGADIIEAVKATGLTSALASVGCAGVAVYCAFEGTTDLIRSIKAKDNIGITESIGHLGLAGASAVETAGTLASLGSVSKFIVPTAVAALNSPLAAALGTTLGVVHGSVEAFLGGREIYLGVKAKDNQQILKGALGLGLGAAIVAIYVMGGLPAALAVGAFYGAEMVLCKSDKFEQAARDLYESARKQAHKIRLKFSS
jgi:hypothetical protein